MYLYLSLTGFLKKVNIRCGTSVQTVAKVLLLLSVQNIISVEFYPTAGCSVRYLALCLKYAGILLDLTEAAHFSSVVISYVRL